MDAAAGANAPAQKDHAYAFGPFVLDLHSRMLFRSGLPLELPPRVFEILECLVIQAGRVVSKDALVEQVWDGAPVGDNNIAQHMRLVRTLLGDVSRPHKYIATVHGRGYRLLVEPRKIGGPEPARPASPVSRLVAIELSSSASFFARMGTAAALDSAMELCRKALDLCGPFAEGHAQMAFTAILKAAFVYGDSAQHLQIARWHAKEALTLDPYSARAHTAMALVAVLSDYAPEKALGHLDAASAISRDMEEIAVVRTVALTAAKRYDEGREAATHALAMHPTSSVLAAYGAFCSYHAGDLESARETLERVLVFKPGAAFATYLLARAYLAQGNHGAARGALMAIIDGRTSARAAYEKFRMHAIAALSFIEARAGEPEQAQALAREVQRSEHCPHVSLAVARAGADDDRGVFDALAEARRRRDPWLPFAGSDPLFARYRTATEFESAVSGETPALKIF